MTRQDFLKVVDQATSRVDANDNPENNFDLIAKLWGEYLGCTVLPRDVAMMMVLLKVVRVRNDFSNMDSLVDIAGYAACAATLPKVMREDA